MNPKRISILLVLAMTALAAYGDGVYFGGTGATNTQWIGYRVSVTSNAATWVAYTLDASGNGRIIPAAASFNQTGSNAWTAAFDENVFHGKLMVFKMAQHALRLIPSRDPGTMQIQDGGKTISLRKMSEADLKLIGSGRIPGASTGSSSRQAPASQTTTKPAKSRSVKSP